MKGHALYILACCLALIQLTVFAQEENRTLWSATWSPDGSYLAVGGVDSTLYIYDGHSYALVREVGLGSWLLRARWHPKEPILAIATDGHEDATGCRLINIESGETTLFKGLHSGSRAITWSPGGNRLAIADYAGVLTIWTSDGNLVTRVEKEHTKSFTSVDWHPQDDLLVVAGEFIQLYDTTGKVIHQIRHRADTVLLLCARWHPSGAFFAIGDYGTDVITPVLQFWSRAGVKLFESDLSEAEFRNISWDRSGRRLATASDALRIWTQEGELLRTFPSDELLWGVDWSPDQTRVVTSSHAGTVVVHDVDTGYTYRVR